MAVLAGAARDAAAGLGTVVLISGEAGIGKSSLVAAIDSVLPPEGTVLRFPSDRQERSVIPRSAARDTTSLRVRLPSLSSTAAT